MATTPLRMDIARVLMLSVSDEDRGVDPQVGWEGGSASRRLEKGMIPSCILKTFEFPQYKGKEQHLPQPEAEMKTVVHKTRLITWSAR